jgi:hypothetical protein
MVELKVRMAENGPELNRWRALGLLLLLAFLPALYCLGLGWLALRLYNKLADWSQRRAAQGQWPFRP